MSGKIYKSILVLGFSIVILGEARAQLIPVLGGQRSGTAAAQFLKIGVGARATAMGEAFVAVANDASSLYWNPAGIVQFKKNEITFNHIEWLVDIKHEFIGYVHHLNSTSSIGVQFTSLNTEDMPVTTEFQPKGTGEYFTFADVLFGLTYATQLTDRFSFGGTIKYFDETLGDDVSMSGVLIDFGSHYKLGVGSARFSVAVTNFGGQMTPKGNVKLRDGREVDNFQSFNPPTLFRVAYAQEIYETEENSLTTSIQLNHPNDNSENINVGAEYWWHGSIALRGGYKINVDEESLSLGAGINSTVGGTNLTVDYSFSNFGLLGNVNRFSLNVKF